MVGVAKSPCANIPVLDLHLILSSWKLKAGLFSNTSTLSISLNLHGSLHFQIPRSIWDLSWTSRN